MNHADFPLSKAEFDAIYSKVPRLTVEIIIKKDNSIYLTKRAIEPCRGQWHLPGGTVGFGEPVISAVKRVAKRELGISVDSVSNKGYIEYPSHYLNGLDSPVGLVFEVESYSGQIKPNREAAGHGWFKTVPENMHADQDRFLIENNYLIEDLSSRLKDA
jgi:ADP-ribose pyrophosphatase YjhB (NUDIX family)